MLWNQAQTPHRASGLTRSLRLGLIFGFPPHSAIRRMSGGRKALLCSAHTMLYPPLPTPSARSRGLQRTEEGTVVGCQCTYGSQRGVPSATVRLVSAPVGPVQVQEANLEETSPCQISEDWGNTGHGLGCVDLHVPLSQEKR